MEKKLLILICVFLLCAINIFSQAGHTIQPTIITKITNDITTNGRVFFYVAHTIYFTDNVTPAPQQAQVCWIDPTVHQNFKELLSQILLAYALQSKIYVMTDLGPDGKLLILEIFL